jgi:hypothetical protein
MLKAETKRIIALALTLLIAMSFVMTFPFDTFAAPPLLPPRPSEPQPPPPEPKDPPDRLERFDPGNAYIDMRVQLGGRQKIWIVLQRQIDGAWRDISDWSGEPDSLANNVGGKILSVFPPRFGWGSLRAMIYESAGGRTIGESRTFYAPTASDQTVIVEVPTTP